MTTNRAGPAPTRLTIPAAVPGELGRSVYSSDTGVVTGTGHGRAPKANISYSVEGACASTTTGTRFVSYRVVDGQDATQVVSSGTIQCNSDGLTINGAFDASPSPRPVTVSLDDSFNGVTTAFVMLAPTP